MPLSICRSITFELRQQHGFEVGGVSCGERCCTNKDLFNSISCLPEMEQKELHQARLSVAAEHLLESIYAPGSLVLNPRRW